MTSRRECYYSNCNTAPKWGVSSSVQTKNPDGTPLTLYACDEHYDPLTTKMREAGTRYSLFPINGPHMVIPSGCGCDDHESERAKADQVYEDELARMPWPARVLVNVAVAGVVLLIGPFMLLYFGGRWLLGWRPRKAD